MPVAARDSWLYLFRDRSNGTFACVLYALLWASLGFAQRRVERPNIVLISIDTLRFDRLGCTGYTKSSTPNLDQLAKEAVLFEHVYTPVPITLPAHASLLTSSHPSTHGVRDNGEALASTVPTLAEQFRNHGYQTAAFIGSFVLDRRFGLARGFDGYWGEFALHRFAGADPGQVQIRGDRVEAAAEDWIREHIPADAQYFGSAIVVEHRFIQDILEGIVHDGLTFAWR